MGQEDKAAVRVKRGAVTCAECSRRGSKKPSTLPPPPKDQKRTSNRTSRRLGKILSGAIWED